MKIRDAKPGDVMRDKDGDMWLRGDVAAFSVSSNGVAYDPYRWTIADADDAFGPFVLVTRLVPEREGE